MTTPSRPRKVTTADLEARPRSAVVAWQGPLGHWSAYFGGELVPGRQYPCDPELSEVLAHGPLWELVPVVATTEDT